MLMMLKAQSGWGINPHHGLHYGRLEVRGKYLDAGGIRRVAIAVPHLLHKQPAAQWVPGCCGSQPVIHRVDIDGHIRGKQCKRRINLSQHNVTLCPLLSRYGGGGHGVDLAAQLHTIRIVTHSDIHTVIGSLKFIGDGCHPATIKHCK
jgi:hypothetical protein